MLQALFLIAAGMILCTGILAAAAAFADHRRHEYLAFALLCIPASGFALATHALYASRGLEEAAGALRVQTAVALMAAPAFFAFVALYTRQAHWGRGLALVCVAFGALIAWNLALPYGIRFSSFEAAGTLVLPWGEAVPRYKGEFDPRTQVPVRAAIWLLFGWAVWRCVVMHRAGARQKAWFLGACLAIYIAGTVHGTFVDTGRVDFVYLTPLAFLAFVLLVAVRLVLDLRDANAALLHRATHDAVSGLPNRAWMEERLDAALQRAAGARGGAALLVVNIDHFKLVNATYGHEVADRFIRSLGARLGETVPAADLATLGGDEFGMLVAHPHGVEQAKAAAREAGEAIGTALRRPFMLDEREIRASASIGIVGLADPGARVADVMRLANVAMLDAKARGRGRSATYEAGMEHATQRRSALDGALREAIEHGGFELRYQPQLDFSGRMIGAEVLLRWRHAVHGDVSPAEFIPIAEQTGLIHAVGEWVLAQACRRLADAGAAPHAQWRLAVNLSAWELVRPSFPERVERVLGKTGADPARLMFELTEGVMLHRLEQVIENMARLRALGVRFSIDDFGTGYSSLAYLRQLPLDQLKIDKVFVAGLEHAGNRALVRSIAEIGAALALEVVAEGVETEAQREVLFGLGCHGVQGFLLAKPMPEAEFLAFASRHEAALPADAIIRP